MAKHNQPPASLTGRSNEMDDRDPTEDELRTIGQITSSIPSLPVPDASRDDDYEDPTLVSSNQRQTPEEMSMRILQLLEQQNKQQEQAASATGGNDNMLAMAIMKLSEVMAGGNAAQLQGSQMMVDMQKRAMYPENRFSHDISVYNPRGDRNFPRPQLKCPMLLPWPAEQDSLSREELELLNLLVEGKYRILRADRTPIDLYVTVEKHANSDELSALVIHHETAYDNFNARLMPHDWLRQMVMSNPLTKERGQLVLTMEEEVAFIKARKFNDGRVAAQGEALVSVGA